MGPAAGGDAVRPRAALGRDGSPPDAVRRGRRGRELGRRGRQRSRRPGVAAATEVTIELRQSPAGFFAHFGGFMIRRAATHTIDEALDGLARISG